MVRIAVSLVSLLPFATYALGAACPMGEMIKRDDVPDDVKARYLRGEGLGGIHPRKKGSKHDDPPPLLDPIAGILSPIGLGGAVPRSDANPEHLEIQRRHVEARLNERWEDADLDAAVLTPVAAKRHYEERGLIGGLLAPLTGILSKLDIPTPQESGLKAIPGNDPDHQYQAPGVHDIRGNCPTLNTLANHGYLSRDGVTTFAEAANAIQTAYSMSFDLAVGLSALGLLAGGDIVTGKYSIGGKSSKVPDSIGPAYGIDRHGLFELDASISRSDRFFGDSHTFNQSKWDDLHSNAKKYGGGLFNAEAFKHNSVEQLAASRKTNPEFTFGPNFFVHYATRALTYRPLPNGTYPNTPDYANIAPFFLNETFPKDWYRIPNSYSFVDLLGDIADLLLFKVPALGRNYDGRFVPLELKIPTAPADVGCFAAAALLDAAPSQLSTEVSAVAAVIQQLLLPVFDKAKCDVSAFSNDAGSNKHKQIYKGYQAQNQDAGSGSGVPNRNVGNGA